MPPERLTLRLAGRDFVVDVLDDSHVQIGDTRAEVSVHPSGLVQVEGAAGGPAWAVSAGEARWVYHDGCVHVFDVQREGRRRRPDQDHGSLAAPMPATVRAILVAVGDVVHRGDTLLVLEAMKMELPLRATLDGTVAAIHCEPGDVVQPGRPLIALDALAPEA